LDEKGELVLDLKAYQVGPHYPVNLLLGNRDGYPYPLYTTPKAALDGLGRGSFRATGGTQVLASRFAIELEQNGEPANRQFYLVEDGRQIFYSANVNENVATATCVHSQGRTVITYETEDGLTIRRTIFILPQEAGMPTAVEAQRVEVENHSGRDRDLQLVMTGMFGIADASTLANDVVYANVVIESEMAYRDGTPVAMTLHHKPKDCACEKRFALLLSEGRTLDSFCVDQADFIGRGTLDHPELVGHLPNRYGRKMCPFFAMGTHLTVADGATGVVDGFAGMMEGEGDISGEFDAALDRFVTRYSDPAALAETFQGVVDFWDTYPAYLQPKLGDAAFDTYVGHNLPFQVLYQTYVSRAFAWTQKSYRETGFREIQDIYASMYYLVAAGDAELVAELLSSWVENVWPMGYAYHDFTFEGKEPGDCSDDQLWLVQAVWRYVSLTGDTDFLSREFKMAGPQGGTRPLWDTLMAILTYSGKISVGAHGMPLLDKADWNDTLRLDHHVMKGPEKEQVYREQLERSGKPYGTPLENTLSESVMNACLLKIAADEVAEMAQATGRAADGATATGIARAQAKSMQDNAWKGSYFARCLMNDDRGHDYLGANGDGLALEDGEDGTYFLNSFSWSILAGVASEEQIRLMLGKVQKNLQTPAGLRLSTLVDFDRLGIATGTALYFPGDRENGGVFKHAAMMATVAALKASKQVSDQALAHELADLAFFMIDKTLPYRTMADPFRIKGNPRFCTQYNNSDTGENIGPMLSGTATWLTLAVYEFLGIDVTAEGLTLSPVMPEGREDMGYVLELGDATYDIEVHGGGERFHVGPDSTCTVDGQPTGLSIGRTHDGARHRVVIDL
ncbi:MAG: hypothetical protein PHR15_00005, partial [Atopobiaceae bacterium]|nr:hypothetical protein [Atopobiaceae bacterium]